MSIKNLEIKVYPYTYHIQLEDIQQLSIKTEYLGEFTHEMYINVSGMTKFGYPLELYYIFEAYNNHITHNHPLKYNILFPNELVNPNEKMDITFYLKYGKKIHGDEIISKKTLVLLPINNAYPNITNQLIIPVGPYYNICVTFKNELILEILENYISEWKLIVYDNTHYIFNLFKSYVDDISDTLTKVNKFKFYPAVGPNGGKISIQSETFVLSENHSIEYLEQENIQLKGKMHYIEQKINNIKRT